MFKNVKLRKALIGAGLGVLGACAVAGGTWLTIDHIVSQKQNVDDSIKNDSNVIVDGNELSDDEIVNHMPGSIAFTNRMIKNSQVKGAKCTFNATVLPENATDKTLNWSLQWSDNGNHGNVTDYISLSKSSDTHTVTLTCLKGFNYQIKLIGKASGGQTASATIDMVKYVSSVTIGTDQGDVSINLDGREDKIVNTTHTYDISKVYQSDKAKMGLFTSFNYNVTGTVGTVERFTKKRGSTDILDDVYIGYTSDFLAQYKTLGFDSCDNGTGNMFCSTRDFSSGYITYANLFLFSEYAHDDLGITEKEYMNGMTNNSFNEAQFYVSFNSTYNSNTIKQNIGYTFDFNSNSFIDTSSVSISSSSYVYQ